MDILVFILSGHRYALHLGIVERVVQAAAVTPLPGVPDVVLGVVNVAGRIVPVFDARRRFGLPARDMVPEDHFVLARTSRRSVALLVDSVEGLVEKPEEEITAAGNVLPGLEYVEGVARLEDGLVLIHDLDRFLSIEEAERLEEAMEKRVNEGA